MTLPQRAAQVWAVLALAARNRQTLTYEIVGDCTGLAPVGLGKVLALIQNDCHAGGLPPLTALVVSKATGMPSEGLHVPPEAVPRAQRDVFEHAWRRADTPTPEALGAAPPMLPTGPMP